MGYRGYSITSGGRREFFKALSISLCDYLPQITIRVGLRTEDGGH